MFGSPSIHMPTPTICLLFTTYRITLTPKPKEYITQTDSSIALLIRSLNNSFMNDLNPRCVVPLVPIFLILRRTSRRRLSGRRQNHMFIRDGIPLSEVPRSIGDGERMPEFLPSGRETRVCMLFC